MYVYIYIYVYIRMCIYIYIYIYIYCASSMASNIVRDAELTASARPFLPLQAG